MENKTTIMKNLFYFSLGWTVQTKKLKKRKKRNLTQDWPISWQKSL